MPSGRPSSLAIWLCGHSRTNHGKQFRAICKDLGIPWFDCPHVPHPNRFGAKVDELQLIEAILTRRARLLVELQTERLDGVHRYEEAGHVSWQIGASDDHHCHLALASITGQRGPEHRDTARAENDLGLCLYHLGRHAEAERWQRKWLAVVAKRSGPESAEAAGERARLLERLVKGSEKPLLQAAE